jgi:hypothetical protein
LPEFYQEGSTLTPPNSPSVLIPAGEAITLDGTLDPEEWASASRHPFSGGEVLLQQQGDLVSVGVRGSQAGFPHIALSVGDSVWVLHASAALGQIVYARDERGWVLVGAPVWEVRDPGLTPSAGEIRNEYLQANHWVGSTGRMGNPGESEFLVRLTRFGRDGVRFAVAHLAPESPQGTARWPETNLDDIGTLQLLTGPMPERLEFTTNHWALLLVTIRESDPPPSFGR